ncbi:DinB family protein [Lacimicrobium alkaliphilum]|uniref:Diguanylate cyclase n=1 Tax=Lacimicrobium alkaliphilum TaxID=1526571 RepID=A0A0U3AS41_9ALTE|nr:DinB family protein [Lacimicrobium alkaliphilum]ALS96879.1 diguanylate cyclase [Lacimicrobium alkaliphilum]
MSRKHHFELMASYNQWMNEKIYRAAGQLNGSELAEERGAFFGSVLGTLNHIVVGDTIWLQRFATHPSCTASLQEVAEMPSPTRLNQIVFDDFTELHQHRSWLDQQIINWIAGLREGDLDDVLSYHNTQGIAANKRFSNLILHFFNHQTHHRGQISVLLSQSGLDIGVTDLLALIPQEATDSRM